MGLVSAFLHDSVCLLATFIAGGLPDYTSKYRSLSPSDKIMRSTTATVGAAFDERNEALESEKLVLSEKCSHSQGPRLTFEHVFEPAMALLPTPWKIYQSGTFTMKPMVLRLAFQSPITYTKKTGVRTAQSSDVFRLLRSITSKCEMAHLRGFEPLVDLTQHILSKDAR